MGVPLARSREIAREVILTGLVSQSQASGGNEIFEVLVQEELGREVLNSALHLTAVDGVDVCV